MYIHVCVLCTCLASGVMHVLLEIVIVEDGSMLRSRKAAEHS